MDPPAPLPDEASEVDEELWAIIERGLEKNAERRWGSMRELGLALRRWLVRRGERTDIAGRTIVTSDFPAPDEDLEVCSEPEARLKAPRVPTLAMPMVATTMDEPPTPPALAITVPPPASPRERLGLMGAAVALLALPLAALGAQPTPSALDAHLTRFTSDAVANLSGTEALAAIEDDDAAPSPATDGSADDEPESDATTRLDPGTRSSPTVAAPVRGYRAKPSPPVAPPAEPTPRPAQRHLAGSSLPLPTAPRFR
jgi:eukaryotic-like serine/threonine-protein kinase